MESREKIGPGGKLKTAKAKGLSNKGDHERKKGNQSLMQSVGNMNGEQNLTANATNEYANEFTQVCYQPNSTVLNPYLRGCFRTRERPVLKLYQASLIDHFRTKVAMQIKFILKLIATDAGKGNAV